MSRAILFALHNKNYAAGKANGTRQKDSVPLHVSLLELVDNIADFVLDIVNRYL